MKNLSIKEIQSIVHENAKAKGWHNEPRSALEIHCLIHSEISEATESYRNKEPIAWSQDLKNGAVYFPENAGFDKYKPEGEAIELADAVIRIMDYFELKGWDLGQMIELKHNYNTKRPYRHGNKVI